MTSCTWHLQLNVGRVFQCCTQIHQGLSKGVATDTGCTYQLVVASPLPAYYYTLVAHLSTGPAGVAGGATRAALTQHFARQGNAADISAKEGTQVDIVVPEACLVQISTAVSLQAAGCSL